MTLQKLIGKTQGDLIRPALGLDVTVSRAHVVGVTIIAITRGQGTKIVNSNRQQGAFSMRVTELIEKLQQVENPDDVCVIVRHGDDYIHVETVIINNRDVELSGHVI